MMINLDVIVKMERKKKLTWFDWFYPQKWRFQFRPNIGGFVFFMTLICNLRVTAYALAMWLEYILESDQMFSCFHTVSKAEKY